MNSHQRKMKETKPQSSKMKHSQQNPNTNSDSTERKPKSGGNSFWYCSGYISICKVLRTISASRLDKSVLAGTHIIIVCLRAVEPEFQKNRNPDYSLVSSAYRTVLGT